MTYKVGIVGEAHYQSTISKCAVGESVRIFHEIGNPYDAKALVVISRSGEPIGYIGKGHWVRDLIHDEGRSCEARICSITEAAPGKLAVVLDVVKGADPVQTRAYKR